VSASPSTVVGRSEGTTGPRGEVAGAETGANASGRTISPFAVVSGVALAYLVAALALSAPGVAHLGTRLLGVAHDPAQNAWNVAWVRGWLEGRHGLYVTRELLYPDGANLAWMTLALPSTIVGALLVPVIGLVGAYNLALLATLAADGVAMYAFARRVGITRGASFVAGLAFEASPYLLGQLEGRMHMVGAYAIPLVAACVWGILDRKRPRLWHFVLLGGLGALAAYDAPDYALYAGLAAGLILLLHPGTKGRRVVAILERWQGWLVAALVGWGLAFPLLHALLAGPLAVGAAAGTPASTPWVADLISFFVPPATGAFRFLGDELHLPVAFAFPGFFALGAFVVLLGWRDRIPPERRGLLRLCLVGMAIFAVLSLGTHLHADGWSLPVPLPYLLLARLPGFADTLPDRFAVLVALFSSLLVGVAADLVVAETRRRPGDVASPEGSPFPARAQRRATRGAVLVGVTLFALSVPYPFPSIRPVGAAFVPSVRAGGGTVLFVPAQIPWTADWAQLGPEARDGYWYMYADAELGLPTPDGYLSRLPAATTMRIDASFTLSYVTLMQRTDPRDGTRAEVAAAGALRGFLRRMDVHSIVLRTSELAHPVADAGWFAAHAGVPTHLTRFPGGIWVLSLESSSG